MTQNKKQKKLYQNKILANTLIISFVIANFFISAPLVAQESEESNENTADTGLTREQREEEARLAELSGQIGDKQNEINTLQKEIDAYQEQIEVKQKEARGLRNQIAILDNQIAKTNLDVQATEIRIEQTNLEIQAINLQIKDLEIRIEKNKEKIAEFIRLIYKGDQVSYFEVLLANNTFSDFFDQMQHTQQINGDLKSELDKLKGSKNDLEVQRTNWEAKAELEEELKTELQKKNSELGEQNTAQGLLLVQARLTEQQYKNYQYQLQLEQQQINSDIVTLEKEVRQQLEQREIKERFRGFGPARFSWPVDPSRGISAYFHDPDYPFRYIFEHPAVDIRAYQGTSIKAPESGYVARVKFDGSTAYSYVMLIHNDGLSTVFGHVSSVYVNEDEFVTKGQTVASSGGTPGTVGAGNLSTGPHLHFEVRLNGIPVNPLEYLP